MFRGRELSHRELGTKVLDRIVNELKEVAVIEATARMEGRQMFMILAPNPRMMQSQRDKAKSAAAAAAATAAPAAAATPAPAAGANETDGAA
jgi:translation initiation factor IF-3